VCAERSTGLKIDTSLLKPGLRLAIGLSGGADSVALLRALVQRAGELGLVLHAAHLHHGLRGTEADADRDFCCKLAEKLGLPFHQARVDTAGAAKADLGLGKAAETIEAAARRLRYAWFRELMASGTVDAVAIAHTRDDQAETVLAKFLRGAWTEGLSGIHPVVRFPEGRILRPLLATSRAEIEAYLQALAQGWREDSSNRNLTFTRNRIRHELLPLLEGWNPRLRHHLAQMAELARDEETWWEAEVARLAGQIVLPGRPVRGGGRAAGEGLAVEVARLAELPVAVQRRVLRMAAERLGTAPDFDGTEALRNLALTGRSGQKCELAGLEGERTHRELQLTGLSRGGRADGDSAAVYMVAVPGEVEAREWGIRVQISFSSFPGFSQAGNRACLRPWKPGDRVRLRYSGGMRKVKEVLERMHVTGSARANWPVLELDGRIVWMQGVQAEPEPGFEVLVSPLDAPSPGQPGRSRVHSRE
jgi:tRNA(Ile)-lysidine synthase